jgi:hypothetical protein
VCAFSTCRICGRSGLAVCRAINVGCSCPISDLSVRQSQRPPLPSPVAAADTWPPLSAAGRAGPPATPSVSSSSQLRPACRALRMHSPAAVALTPRLAAILRLDMPAADSLSTSRILRIGNLGPGMPRSCEKGAKPCRFADHPTAPIIPVHRLVAIARNGWSRSIGTLGRNQSELVVAINRCAQLCHCLAREVTVTRAFSCHPGCSGRAAKKRGFPVFYSGRNPPNWANSGDRGTKPAYTRGPVPAPPPIQANIRSWISPPGLDRPLRGRVPYVEIGVAYRPDDRSDTLQSFLTVVSSIVCNSTRKASLYVLEFNPCCLVGAQRGAAAMQIIPDRRLTWLAEEVKFN